MTASTFVLVRHAPHAWQGTRLVGRAPGVPLAPDATHALARLAARLRHERIDAVHASPLQRAQETAQVVSAVVRRPVETVEALTEVDFGAWTGVDVTALADDPAWRRWCTDKGTARAPGGESVQEVQARVVAHARAVHARAPGSRTVLVSHGDPLRTLVAHAIGLAPGAIDRLALDPASVSVVALDDGGGALLSLNDGGDA